jgi:hypothetical protein
MQLVVFNQLDFSFLGFPRMLVLAKHPTSKFAQLADLQQLTLCSEADVLSKFVCMRPCYCVVPKYRYT